MKRRLGRYLPSTRKVPIAEIQALLLERRKLLPRDALSTFNGNIANLAEEVGESSLEVSKAGFAQDASKSTRQWQMSPENIADLISAFPIILGNCQYTPTNSGKLNRTLPQADPLYAWLYASSISNVEGYGKYTKVSADPMLEAPGFPYGTLWDQYRLEVESLPRPFPVLQNWSIPQSSSSWYAETSGGTTQQYFSFAPEYLRYCTWNMQPQSDYITQNKGRMVFNSGDTGNGKGFVGMPRVYLPNQLYTVTWYYVPVRLTTSPNSYLQAFRGRVNQNKMAGPDGLTFNPGQLLYLNYGIQMFTPPVQALVSLTQGGSSSMIVSTEKFVHITLTFLYTQRILVSSPSSAPTNKNYVVGGHNLLPWSDGNFRYAQSTIADTGYSSNFRPTWLSAPLEALFTDCDSNSTQITLPTYV